MATKDAIPAPPPQGQNPFTQRPLLSKLNDFSVVRWATTKGFDTDNSISSNNSTSLPDLPERDGHLQSSAASIPSRPFPQPSASSVPYPPPPGSLPRRRTTSSPTRRGPGSSVPPQQQQQQQHKRNASTNSSYSSSARFPINASSNSNTFDNTLIATSSSIAGKDSLETANVPLAHPPAPSPASSNAPPKLQRRQSLRFPIKIPGPISESPTQVAPSDSSASAAPTAATTSSVKSSSSAVPPPLVSKDTSTSKKVSVSQPPPSANRPPSRSSATSKAQQPPQQSPKPQPRSQSPVSTPAPIKRRSISRTVSEFSIPSPPDDDQDLYQYQYQYQHPSSSSRNSSTRTSPPNSFYAKESTPSIPEEKRSAGKEAPPPAYVFDRAPVLEPKNLSQQSTTAVPDTPPATTKASSPTSSQSTTDKMSSPSVDVKNAEQQAQFGAGQQQRGLTLGLAPPMPGLSGSANTVAGNLLKGPVGPDGNLRDAALMVGIKLDLEAEVHLTARIRGDILVGLY